jgi:hypothetical protein
MPTPGRGRSPPRCWWRWFPGALVPPGRRDRRAVAVGIVGLAATAAVVVASPAGWRPVDTVAAWTVALVGLVSSTTTWPAVTELAHARRRGPPAATSPG